MSQRAQALYQHQKSLSQICARMMQAGVLVDQGCRKELAATLLAEHEEKKALLLEKVGVAGFRGNANDLRSILFKRHEKGELKRFSLPDPLQKKMWSSASTISVEEKSLLLLLADPDTPPEIAPIVEAYWDATTPLKARSTFVTSELIDQAIGLDGRLRPQWNSCGTVTGRFSSRTPNFQNLPKKLRAMYVAKPGHVIINADFSQLELRVMAAVAGDEVLARGLAIGDVYTHGAKQMFGLPAHLVKCECSGRCVAPTQHLKDSVRKAQKILHLASQYAAGTTQIYTEFLKTDRTKTWTQVRVLHDGWKRTYEGTVAYWEREYARAIALGYSESRILGRRRVYPAEPKINEVVNFPVQATAAEIANLALIELDARLPGDSAVIWQQHDAIGVECPEDVQEARRALMQECMTRPRIIEGIEYAFPVDCKVGTRWSSL